MPKIVGISTCKGRLTYIKQSSEFFIKNTPYPYVLVDYNCPENSSDWIVEHYKNPRITPVKIKNGQEYFHKTVALNAGAKFAIDNYTPEYLMFFDADTIILDGFVKQIEPILSKDKFFIIKPSKESLDLTGFIIVPVKLFRDSRGYEESFRDWGCEDIEFRVRLYAKHGFDFELLSYEFLNSIPHGDDLRTMYYREKNKQKSDSRNFKRFKKMFYMYRGQDIAQFETFEDHKKINWVLGNE